MSYTGGFDLAVEESYPTPFRNSTLFPLLLLSLAMSKHTPPTKKFFKTNYDFIVGAGSGGSVVAARLSEDNSTDVLLLEAGKSAPLLTDVPSAQAYLMESDIYWNFKTQPQRFSALRHNDRRAKCPSGKVVGGSSTDNTMFYLRGNRADYNGWESEGADKWNWTYVFPYFLKPEDNTDPDIAFNGYHSIGGPLTVGRFPYMSEFRQALSKAAINMSYPFHDINGARQTGFYDIQGCIRRGQRVSTAKAFLVPAENRKNLDIIAQAYVTKILIEGGRAVGVRFDFGGMRYEIKATNVILSAGAMKSPQILMLSGIGPRETLDKFGIPVIADLPVGENYQDVSGSTVNFVSTIKRPTLDEKLRDDANILEYIYNRRGPLAGIIGNFGMAYLTDNATAEFLDLPDYHLFFNEVSYGNTPPFGLSEEAYYEVFGPYLNKPVIQCVSQYLTPQSRGRVSIQSTNPYDPPLIDPNYYEVYKDLRDVVQGMMACYRIMNNRFMKELRYVPFDTRMPGCTGPPDSYEYLECYARSLTLGATHQGGSNKMGSIYDPRTVVDPQLRVKGIEGLRIVDASVMPFLPHGGTNNPVIMMAERAADIIKGIKPY